MLWKQGNNELFEDFKTQIKGLCSEEATKRIEEYGENKLKEGKKKGLIQVFVEQFKDLLVAILIVAAIISTFTGGLESAIVILTVLILNAILGTVQHFKAEKSLESLKAMSAPNATLIRDGEKIKVPAKLVVPGDILLLEAGDVAVADGRILENYSLQVNESALTGESENVNKISDIIEKDELPLGDRLNMVYSSSLVSYGRAVVLVTATGMNTEIGKIAKLLNSAQEKTTPLQKNLDEFSKKLSIIIIGICIVVFALSIWRGHLITNALMFAVSLAVAAIPEALSSIVTIGLAIGTQKMAKENAIIKNLRAVESLGCVSVICSDKTGTLTQNKMTVQKIFTSNSIYDENNINMPLSKDLITTSVLCNDGLVKDGSEIGDPTEIALLNFSNKIGLSVASTNEKFTRLSELPFDSDRKLMSTLNKMDTNIMMTKGAPDMLLSRCNKILDNNTIREITNTDIGSILEHNTMFSSQGLRVLAFARKEMEHTKLTINDENDLTFIGLIAMMDPPRVESAQAVKDCKSAGIRPVMITGDHKITASAIAKKIGILEEGDRVLEGKELEYLSDNELKESVKDISVYARVSPEHKIRIVKAWQENGFTVAMTGDGVNDAPALKQADIGIAMGITGTEVSKDASKMILTDDNFATIIKAVGNGRSVYANIKNSIQFLLSGNLAAIIAVLFTSLLDLPLPFTAVQLLFINLLTDSLPALAINMEHQSSDLLKAKPRNTKESILTKDFLEALVMQGGLISIVTIIGFYIGLSVNDYLACTMAFGILCLARLFHGFNCRGSRSIFKLQKNMYSYGAFVLGTILLMSVLFIPSLHNIFDINDALNVNYIFVIVVLAFIPTGLIQLVRVFRK
ncbi:MAG: cation-translocating P-type ATPase [Lachnospirales bacterium]